jgi:dTDP-glucose pyrophosphorylase
MINILIPLAGNNKFEHDSEYIYPKPLLEIRGKTILEHVIDNFAEIEKEKHYIFVLTSQDCKQYNLDSTIRLLVKNCEIIKLDNITEGTLCTALMAIDCINNSTPLIISNADQIFQESLADLIVHFENYDAGVPVFESVHPRWSYVRVNKNNEIIQTAEKKPISKNAIAGLFYFKHGKEFIESAMDVIKKDTRREDKFYISSTLNEMVLKNKKILAHKIDKNKYYSFYTPQKIKDFDRRNQNQRKIND